MSIKRIRVVPSRNGVKVMGFSHAARGAEALIGWAEMPLGEIAEQLENLDVQKKIGLDQAPGRRSSASVGSLPGIGG